MVDSVCLLFDYKSSQYELLMTEKRTVQIIRNHTETTQHHIF